MYHRAIVAYHLHYMSTRNSDVDLELASLFIHGSCCGLESVTRYMGIFRNKMYTPEPQFYNAWGEPEIAEIIRAAAYHRREFDLAVVQISPSPVEEDLRNSLAWPLLPVREGLESLGSLETLPVEILHMICDFLDIQATFHFREVNYRAWRLLNSLRLYQDIIIYAPRTLCAMLRTQIASWYTLRDLYTALCTEKCTVCMSRFGGFLFMPTCTRCCFVCIQAATQFQVSAFANAKKHRNISCKSMPTLRTIPGIYSMDEVSRKRRIKVVAIQPLLEASGRLPKHVPSPTLRFMAATTLGYLDKRSGEVQNGVSCKGCKITFEKALRNRHSLSTPRATLAMVSGRDEVYSRDGFLDHFHSCPEAQMLWKSSMERSPIKEPEFALLRQLLPEIKRYHVLS
jgi:hypothetical protein